MALRNNLSLPKDARQRQFRVALTEEEHNALNDALSFEGRLKSRMLRDLILGWLADYYGKKQEAEEYKAAVGGGG